MSQGAPAGGSGPSAATPSPLVALGRQARSAGRILARASSAHRDEALLRSADLLDERVDRILDANAQDLDRAARADTDPTSLDRLRLDSARVASMAPSVIR